MSDLRKAATEVTGEVTPQVTPEVTGDVTGDVDLARVGEVGVWGEKAKPTWHCPLKKPDCKENCGSYGCGN